MRPIVRCACACACVLALAACESATKQDKGTVAGAVVGAAVGSTIGSGSGRTAAIAIGTIAGAVIGGNIGKKMDEADRLKAAQALETAPTGQRTTWTNPDTGARYAMTPTRTYEGPAPCRDFTVDATIDGKPEQVKGKACRQADGSWKKEG